MVCPVCSGALWHSPVFGDVVWKCDVKVQFDFYDFNLVPSDSDAQSCDTRPLQLLPSEKYPSWLMAVLAIRMYSTQLAGRWTEPSYGSELGEVVTVREGSSRSRSSTLFTWLSVVVDHEWMSECFAESVEFMSNWPHMHMRREGIISFSLLFSVLKKSWSIATTFWALFTVFVGVVIVVLREQTDSAPVRIVFVLSVGTAHRLTSALNGNLELRCFRVWAPTSSWEIHAVNVAWLFSRRQSGSWESETYFLPGNGISNLVRCPGHQNIMMNTIQLSSGQTDKNQKQPY